MTDAIRARRYDVFVSYKREDDAAREVLCDALVAAGLEPWWDGKLGQGDFRDQIRDRINDCGVTVVLWSAKAEAKPDEVTMEMAHAFGIGRLLPLRLDAAPLPAQFAKENFLPFDKWADPNRAKRQIGRIVEEVLRLAPRPERRRRSPTQPSPKALAASPRVHLGDLPAAPDHLVGRERELQLLRDAWASKPPGKVNAVVLSAMGGAGKSALLRTFVNEVLAGGGGGAERIYAWSACSQGSGDARQADADAFIAKALSDFGYKGPPISDAGERARKLAGLVQARRVLFVLDGLEPLQDPPGLNRGRFKDKPFAALIQALGAHNKGLVVLTSRQQVPELEGFGPLAVHHPLDELTDDAGADLLVELGVRGRHVDLRAAVADIGGHALSVTLLGTYLAEVCGGDIAARDRFDLGRVVLGLDEADSADRTLLHARRAEKVMAGYLEQFDRLAADEGARGLGGPERALLYLLGLFERPADGAAVSMLLAERIPGLTDALFVEPLERVAWLGLRRRTEFRELTAAEHRARLREAKSRLRKLRLLAEPDPADPQALDAHPVVRAYFARRLTLDAPDAARIAHDTLYRHYAAAAPERPESLEAMQPLFHAIRHGVAAGRAQEAFDGVLWRRIVRGNEHYVVRVLAAHGALLSAFAAFTRGSWTDLDPALSSSAKGLILQGTAFALAQLGRVRESIAPRRAGLDAAVAAQDWGNAVRYGVELSDGLIQLGQVEQALEWAERATHFAGRSRHPHETLMALAYRGAALLALGRDATALDCFAEAEAIKARVRPEEPFLISFSGYLHCDALLATGHTPAAVAQRARQLLAVARRDLGSRTSRSDIAFASLVLARALDAAADPMAATALDRALDEMRKAGGERYVPLALLARATHRRRRIVAGEAWLIPGLRQDLREVAEIAAPDMRLHLADLALEEARVSLEVDNARDRAVAEIEKAARLIAETGYHRRDGELAALRARLAADT